MCEGDDTDACRTRFASFAWRLADTDLRLADTNRHFAYANWLCRIDRHSTYANEVAVLRFFSERHHFASSR
jgi:hypothetical protein